MTKLLYIVLGGATGAGLRYAVSLMAFRIAGGAFPWGTLIVNVVGSLLAGFAWGVLGETSGSQRINALFIIGLMGAFTTFSAYSIESMRLYHDGKSGLALVNIFANNIGALTAVLAGFALARSFFGSPR